MSRKKQSQTPVLIVYVATMLVSLAIFGSAALFLRDRFVTKPSENLENVSADDASETEQAKEYDYASARETVLFVGAEGEKINGIALLRVLPDELSVKVVPVSPMILSSVSGTDGTIASLFEMGGMSYLKSAVENVFGITCDKYIKISDEGFKSLVDSLGGTNSYSFPYDIYYKNEATGEVTSFSQGPVTRTLYGDDIRRIITYPLYQNGNETKAQVLGELSVSLINSACTNNSGSIVTNIKSIFNIIYNNSDTDITSKSFSDVRPAYERLVSQSQTPATYRLPSGSWDELGRFTVDEAFKTDIREYFELSEG